MALKKYYPDYHKNDERMYSKTIDNVQKAIKNAKQLEQDALSSGKRLHTHQFQPSTEAYKVVLELLKHWCYELNSYIRELTLL